MLTEKQLVEIREHLERAQNPVFYFDNDADGLCSFILLRKYLGRGKGVSIRSFPELNATYARKAEELKADAIFILDKPVVSKEFVKEIASLNLPLIWIDHHDVENEWAHNEEKQFFIYNPTRNSGKNKSNEPTTYLSYSVSRRKEDRWMAVVGCVADHFIPEFISDFEKEYPDLWGKVRNEFDAFFNTEIGTIAMALNFGLKDSITNVVRMQNFLIECNSPRDVLAESSGNFQFRKKYEELKKKYDDLLSRAKTFVDGKTVFFEYSGETSMSSEVSNGLAYYYPEKYVAVAYKNGAVANVSLRGKNVKKILMAILKNVEGSGGGHQDAVGARLDIKNLEKFKELFLEEVDKL